MWDGINLKTFKRNGTYVSLSCLQSTQVFFFNAMEIEIKLKNLASDFWVDVDIEERAYARLDSIFFNSGILIKIFAHSSISTNSSQKSMTFSKLKVFLTYIWLKFRIKYWDFFKLLEKFDGYAQKLSHFRNYLKNMSNFNAKLPKFWISSPGNWIPGFLQIAVTIICIMCMYMVVIICSSEICDPEIPDPNLLWSRYLPSFLSLSF